jgi:hypothetical protein
MNIEFVRSGGFTGVRLTANIDSAKLSQEQAATLDKLVTEAGFFELPAEIKPDNLRPDRFEYQVVINSRGKKNSITVSDAVIPESLQPLVDYLTKLAVTGKK